MDLCVGAVSQRVIEEAAKCHVHQIVASRAQVNETGGYVGWDQFDLVQHVKYLSGGATLVIRDHGGPLQGGFEDDGIESFMADVTAGFNGLHIDVCKLPYLDQPKTLVKLVEQFGDQSVTIEVGGERVDQDWNDTLLNVVMSETAVIPTYQVIDTGGHVWAERQVGHLRRRADVELLGWTARNYKIKTKAHNQDWFGRRLRYDGVLDAYNIAPEFARVETDALLTVLPWSSADRLLQLAYDSGTWRRWFGDDEGTWDDRARCAVHYIMNQPEAAGVAAVFGERDEFVRKAIRNAILAG